MVATSADGGEHFRRGTVDERIAPPQRVMLIYTMPPAALATDASGHLFAAWTDARNGDWDVLLRRSLDGGCTWQPPARLNDDPVGDGRHQYMPRLAVASNGRVDAIFYDRRNDPDNLRNDVYYTYSTDGGGTFSGNVRVTSTSFDSRKGTKYPIPSAVGQHEFGSRLGLLSRDSSVLAAWTDTRNNRIGVQQDIFATEVDLPIAANAWSGWTLVAAGALLLTATGWVVTVLTPHRKRMSRRLWGPQ